MSQPTSDYSRPLPETFFVNPHEAEVLKWGQHFGILDQITDPGTLGPRWSIGVYRRHPTHWFLFVRVWGHPKPHENGWSMHLYPKSLYPSVQMCEERFLDQIRSG